MSSLNAVPTTGGLPRPFLSLCTALQKEREMPLLPSIPPSMSDAEREAKAVPVACPVLSYCQAPP